MTDHQDRPDIRQRRRVTRLRAELGLAPVPPHVGTRLRVIAPRVCEQVSRLLRHDRAYAMLSPRGQTQLLAALASAVDEFARLVEDRPPQAPPAEAILLEILHVEDQPELCRAALEAALQTLRDVTRILWPQLPHAQAYAAHLDAAMVRYAKRLYARTMNAQRPPTTRPTSSRRTGETDLNELLALAEHRWGNPPAQLYLSVSTLGPADTPAPRDTANSVSAIVTDHIVTIAQHPIAPSIAPARPTSTTQPPPITVCIGPVPASEIAAIHDIALLLLRLIRAGVATPPSPVQIHVPNLGFLHPSPSEASVRKITDLLLPLTEQSSQRRSALARTLQLCLRTATTAQSLARQLAMHPQTVHNHVAALRTLYNPDLDFAEDNLAMQAALDLVLPLWDLEAAGRRNSPPPN